MPEQNDQDRELIDAIDRLERSMLENAQVSEENRKTQERLSQEAEKAARRREKFALTEKGARTGLAGAQMAARGGYLGEGRLAQALGRQPTLMAQIRPMLTAMMSRASALHPALRIVAAAVISKAVVGQIDKRMGRIGLGLTPASQLRFGKTQLQNADKQTELLAELVRETKLNNRTIQEEYRRRLARRDPFGRDPAEMGGRGFMQLARNTPTPSQAIRAANTQAARNRLADSQGALSRAFNEVRAPYDFIGAELGASFRSNVAANLRWMNQAGKFLFPTHGVASLFGRTEPERDPRRGGFLGGQAERDLFLAQTRGPGNIAGAVTTARAGTRGDYQLRVQLQREELQREVTKQWQDRVIKAMEELVELEKLGDDDLYRKKIEFGRPVGAV